MRPLSKKQVQKVLSAEEKQAQRVMSLSALNIPRGHPAYCSKPVGYRRR